MMTETPMIAGILETSLYVSDLSRSAAFYHRVFGFRLLFEDQRMCAFQIPSCSLLLLFKHNGSLDPSYTPGGIIPAHGGSGASHLCFAIPFASLASWAAHLEKESVPLESLVRQHFGGTSLYFRDPDGHSLEVATPGLWENY
jgi:catechol 2,3-dioxygenase-like lactoylglutathione lyase family enzyme